MEEEIALIKAEIAVLYAHICKLEHPAHSKMFSISSILEELDKEVKDLH